MRILIGELKKFKEENEKIKKKKEEKPVGIGNRWKATEIHMDQYYPLRKQ
jgi:hypothetical protein